VEEIIRGRAARNSLLASRLAALKRLAVPGSYGAQPLVADAAPDGGGSGEGLPMIGDPSPEDLAGMSRVQIESRLAEILHARKRLDLLEKMLNDTVDRG
jgi:hypothetical protein